MTLLKEIANVQTGPFGSQLHKDDYVEVGTPIVTVEHLGNKIFTEQNLPKVSDEDRDRLQKYVLKEGDTVFSRVGSVDRCSFVDKDHDGWMFSGRCLRVRPDSNVNPEYLYYFFTTESTKQLIRSIAVGATMPSINTKILSEVDVPLPDIEVQDGIVNVLSAIDDKIAINEKINRNLYEQIEALCKAWFTDYEPFGGECPDNWKTTPLSEIAEFISGYSYKGKELVEESVKAMATIKNFERKGGFKLDGYKQIEPSDKLKTTQHVELFDTLVAHTDLTQNADVIGNAELVLSKSGFEDIVFSMDLVKVLPKNGNVSKFLLAALLHSNSFKQHCLGYVNGTTVLHLSKKALPDYELPLPTDMSVLKPLSDLLEVLYKQLASNIESNIRLEKLRDSLLPKLMSGELDVSELEI